MPTVVTNDIGKIRNQFNGSGTTPVDVLAVAAYNPVKISLERRDFSGTTSLSAFDSLHEQIDVGSLASEISVGDEIFLGGTSYNGLYEVLDINGTIVTFDLLWSVGGNLSGFINIPSRQNWYLELRIVSGSSFRTIRLTPSSLAGLMNAEISGALRSFITLSTLNITSQTFRFQWKEHWIGSDESFSSDYPSALTDRPIYVAGAFQMGDPKDGYYIDYYTNTDGDSASDLGLPSWLTQFDKPILFSGYGQKISWLANPSLGLSSLYRFYQTFYDASGSVVSSGDFGFGGEFFTTNLAKQIELENIAIPDPDTRRTMELVIRRVSDLKAIITPITFIVVPASFQNCNAFLVRWLNTIGGVDYYLFENKVYESDKVESTGLYESYFDSIASKNDYENFTGKRVATSINVGTASIDENVAKGLRSLKSSPLVEWYNPNTNVWIGVRVEPGTFQFRKTLDDYYKVELTFNLPTLFNQTA